MSAILRRLLEETMTLNANLTNRLAFSNKTIKVYKNIILGMSILLAIETLAILFVLLK